MSAALVAFFIALGGRLWQRTYLLLDVLALGRWTTAGAQKTLAAGLGWLPAILLGTITVGGGVLRDVLLARRPGVFEDHTLYATCAAAAQRGHLGEPFAAPPPGSGPGPRLRTGPGLPRSGQRTRIPADGHARLRGVGAGCVRGHRCTPRVGGCLSDRKAFSLRPARTACDRVNGSGQVSTAGLAAPNGHWIPADAAPSTALPRRPRRG
ncbi:trimeric intracellular cation channel family protein [Streptomyces sp. KL116D]|uniref:trimeric intracellular cation channel family protein n=1 Tax=Streptomyces sp. KL116D TaxID=3045152 RepID=UPI003557AEDF